MRFDEAHDAFYDGYARRIWKGRPKKAGPQIARNLIVRALRNTQLSHVLKGHAAVIGILYPPSLPVEWLVEAAEVVLCRATKKPRKSLAFTPRTRKSSKEPT